MSNMMTLEIPLAHLHQLQLQSEITIAKDDDDNQFFITRVGNSLSSIFHIGDVLYALSNDGPIVDLVANVADVYTLLGMYMYPDSDVCVTIHRQKEAVQDERKPAAVDTAVVAAQNPSISNKRKKKGKGKNKKGRVRGITGLDSIGCEEEEDTSTGGDGKKKSNFAQSDGDSSSSYGSGRHTGKKKKDDKTAETADVICLSSPTKTKTTGTAGGNIDKTPRQNNITPKPRVRGTTGKTKRPVYDTSGSDSDSDITCLTEEEQGDEQKSKKKTADVICLSSPTKTKTTGTAGGNIDKTPRQNNITPKPRVRGTTGKTKRPVYDTSGSDSDSDITCLTEEEQGDEQKSKKKKEKKKKKKKGMELPKDLTLLRGPGRYRADSVSSFDTDHSFRGRSETPRSRAGSSKESHSSRGQRKAPPSRAGSKESRSSRGRSDTPRSRTGSSKESRPSRGRSDTPRSRAGSKDSRISAASASSNSVSTTSTSRLNVRMVEAKDHMLIWANAQGQNRSHITSKITQTLIPQLKPLVLQSNKDNQQKTAMIHSWTNEIWQKKIKCMMDNLVKNNKLKRVNARPRASSLDSGSGVSSSTVSSGNIHTYIPDGVKNWFRNWETKNNVEGNRSTMSPEYAIESFNDSIKPLLLANNKNNHIKRWNDDYIRTWMGNKLSDFSRTTTKRNGKHAGKTQEEIGGKRCTADNGNCDTGTMAEGLDCIIHTIMRMELKMICENNDGSVEIEYKDFDGQTKRTNVAKDAPVIYTHGMQKQKGIVIQCPIGKSSL